ncbi:MAG: aminomethyl-transferring glycine dehydrogenase [Flavobacteriales bacterium]
MQLTDFQKRHIGISESDKNEMLKQLNCQSIEELIDKTIPKKIRADKDLNITKPLTEYEMLKHLKELSSKNQLSKNYIGLGYHPAITPSVIQRNIFENPGWYTAYTPYQAEIAQGRLEALINYQTTVVELTGMEIANASLLDEGTATAEAMTMLYGSRTKNQKKNNANKLFVSDEVLPQTLAVLKPKATAFGIELVVGKTEEFKPSQEYFAWIVQYLGKYGKLVNYTNLVDSAKEFEIATIVAADILSLTLLTPPGEWGADVVVGTTQRLGIPLGFGGPHAAYFATLEKYKRNIPGRIIGISKDRYERKAYRMALQTREQHIKRERATSNICTAQVLLAVMAGMYAVYHGAEGLKNIAKEIHLKTKKIADSVSGNVNEFYFDTLHFTNIDTQAIKIKAEAVKVNFYYVNDSELVISINETTSDVDVKEIISLLGGTDSQSDEKLKIPEKLKRTSTFLQEDVFKKYHSETEMMRYIKRLERKDLSLNHSMISLGSCTMKLNAATQMLPLSWAEWNDVHPFQPEEQVEGYLEMIQNLENDLSEITGFSATSLQPNSGAQGEYAGLMVIKKYHESKGDHHRNIVIIPASAHGTNPASATMSGMEVVVVKSLENGNIDFEDLKLKVAKHSHELAALMITYPSTHGVFESHVLDITHLIHEHGGQVYMDGANMNAQVGYTSPGLIGADVCHLNLHKTFAIPHGGGGPGVGPICVAEHLKPFLPSNPIIKIGGEQGIEAISSAPYGSALVLLISYSYIKMLGAEGLKKATAYAILNANYLKSVLEKKYDILYTGENGYVAHEMIVDFRKFKSLGIEVVDVAKRLMDFGFHAPTVSFPVAGTLMIEPTESESKEEIDRFAEALITIKSEIEEIAEGKASEENNVLRNAPHIMEQITADQWDFPYSRSKAAYPLEWVKENKFWATVNRIDEAYGDRNLVCTCTPIEEYV